MTSDQRNLRASAQGAAARVEHVPARTAFIGDLELRYDVFGASGAPTMLLIMGMGFQLIHWPAGFCRQLASSGFRVVRFDNRDSGRSTHFPGQKYSLEDMADDAVALLNALGTSSAHVVGASMGGMVAQTLAIRHPNTVQSLASLMSTTGRRGVGGTSPLVYRHALGKRPRNIAEAVDRRVRLFASIGSPGFDQDLQELRRVTALAYERDPDARGGRRRQHRAVRTAADRTAALSKLRIPTVVVHGTADPMCRPSGGIATASAIPHASLVLVEGMGHDLPPGAWGDILHPIVRNARRSEARPLH